MYIQIAPVVLSLHLVLSCCIWLTSRNWFSKAIPFSASSRFAHARIITICGPAADKNNHTHFGGDNAGNCLAHDVVSASMVSALFSTNCLPQTNGLTQYYIYRIMKVWMYMPKKLYEGGAVSLRPNSRMWSYIQSSSQKNYIDYQRNRTIYISDRRLPEISKVYIFVQNLDVRNTSSPSHDSFSYPCIRT